MNFKPEIILFLSLSLPLCACREPREPIGDTALDISLLTNETPVIELLHQLGKKLPSHYIADLDPKMVALGAQLVSAGKAPHPETGEIQSRISDYFHCTDCHNTAREDASLIAISDPVAKLAYAVANDLPLLQGSTFAGMVNRESWYNGDYAKKYRFSLAVRAARSDLRKATELCSRECSQGRDPEAWEVEAMISYFQTLGWTLGDLGYAGSDLEELKRRALNDREHPGLIEEIESQYALASPATFSSMPEDARNGFAVEGEPDVEIGRQIWDLSCLHCHGAEGASEHYFGDKAKTWKSLARKFKSSSKKSVYGYIRLGTHPEEGKRPYMPNYTQERLSDKQIEDLRGFIESRAE